MAEARKAPEAAIGAFRQQLPSQGLLRRYAVIPRDGNIAVGKAGERGETGKS